MCYACSDSELDENLSTSAMKQRQKKTRAMPMQQVPQRDVLAQGEDRVRWSSSSRAQPAACRRWGGQEENEEETVKNEKLFVLCHVAIRSSWKQVPTPPIAASPHKKLNFFLGRCGRGAAAAGGAGCAAAACAFISPRPTLQLSLSPPFSYYRFRPARHYRSNYGQFACALGESKGGRFHVRRR